MASEYSVESSRLDEELDFMVDCSINYFATFDANSEESKMAHRWLAKLRCEVVEDIEAKRTRNLYLIHLIECFRTGLLMEPFKNYPKLGPLPPFPRILNDIEAHLFRQLVNVRVDPNGQFDNDLNAMMANFAVQEPSV